jgi:hypothetical protein
VGPQAVVLDVISRVGGEFEVRRRDRNMQPETGNKLAATVKKS